MNSITSFKCLNLSGEISVPGDKSISHRALIIGSNVKGKITISNLLESEDVLATAKALKELGVIINKLPDNKWEVFGNGVGSLSADHKILDMGNSGTGARLLMGLVAGSNVEATFIGDDSLSKRPMKRIILPLTQSGATLDNLNSNTLPITIKGSKIPLPIEYKSPISSAQVKSSILLAGLSSLGTTTITEPFLSRDHTERMLTYFGAKIVTKQQLNSTWKISLDGMPKLNPLDIDIPSDPSSASFPIVSAIITPNSRIKVTGVCINELRIGLYKTLIEMGALITFSNKREVNGELIADISAEYSSLKGITVPRSRAASMIDEYPILAVAATRAKGDTIMEGVEELRYKETDRIKSICEGLKSLGFETKDELDSMVIRGKGPNIEVNGNVKINSNLDHRIAMCFLCLGLISKNPIIVKDTDTIKSSFPKKKKKMNKIGAKFEYS